MVESVEDRVSPRPLEDDQEQGEISNKRKQCEPDASRKRVRAETLAEDKSRGKRLFGSLLGTLGGIKKEASSAKSQERAARQAELEERQLKRLQDANEEIAKKQAEANALRKERLREREVLKANERIEAFHAHQVLLANNLTTMTGPPLCYRPWELTKEQEDKIETQIRRAKKEQSKAIAQLHATSTSTATIAKEQLKNSEDGVRDQDRDEPRELDVDVQPNQAPDTISLEATQEIVPKIEEHMREAAEPAAEDGLPLNAQDTARIDLTTEDAKTSEQSSAEIVKAKHQAVTEAETEPPTGEHSGTQGITTQPEEFTHESQQTSDTQGDTLPIVSEQQENSVINDKADKDAGTT